MDLVVLWDFAVGGTGWTDADGGCCKRLWGRLSMQGLQWAIGMACKTWWENRESFRGLQVCAEEGLGA